MDIKWIVGIKCYAGIADIAGFKISRKIYTINGFGQDSGARGFSYPPGATKQKCLGEVIVLDRIF